MKDLYGLVSHNIMLFLVLCFFDSLCIYHQRSLEVCFHLELWYSSAYHINKELAWLSSQYAYSEGLSSSGCDRAAFCCKFLYYFTSS